MISGMYRACFGGKECSDVSVRNASECVCASGGMQHVIIKEQGASGLYVPVTEGMWP
jgi:hypothetical protein